MNSQRKHQQGLPGSEARTEALRPENQRLLAILEEFAARPDDLGDAWWDEFEKSLRENRLRVRRAQDA